MTYSLRVTFLPLSFKNYHMKIKTIRRWTINQASGTSSMMTLNKATLIAISRPSITASNNHFKLRKPRWKLSKAKHSQTRIKSINRIWIHYPSIVKRQFFVCTCNRTARYAITRKFRCPLNGTIVHKLPRINEHTSNYFQHSGCFFLCDVKRRNIG